MIKVSYGGLVLTGAVLIFAGCTKWKIRDPSEEARLFRKVPAAQSGIDFSNVLTESDSFNILGYEFFYNGSGVAVGDVNNDGLSDVFFGANMVTSKLYLNKGNLTFEDATKNSGINTAGKWVTGVNLIDINQDGKLDLYICVGGNIHQDYRNLLYINRSENGRIFFQECAAEAGLDDDGYSTQSAFFDYDLDGDLDLYLLTSSVNVRNKSEIRARKGDGTAPNTDRFFRNEGLNPVTGIPVFHDVSREAGILWDGFGLGIAVCDINKDHWPDVYVANDFISNDLLYINQGNGQFKEMLKYYFKHSSFSAMGTDAADINNDGLVDLFTLDMLPEDNYRKKMMATNVRSVDRYLLERKAGYSPQYIRNTLQLNNGAYNGKYSFSEIGQLAGVFESDWSWVPLLADFDNDGYRDLFIGNGIVRDMTNMDFTAFWTKQIQSGAKVDSRKLERNLRSELSKKGGVKKHNLVYHNTGRLFFEDKSEAWGFDEPSYTTSAVYSDLDNDGDLDLVLNNINDPADIYENLLIEGDSVNSSTHYLQIRLRGDTLNTEGIGATIALFYGNEHQYYEHFPVRGFQSAVDPKVHFGLGEIDLVDSLEIVWPDGRAETLRNLKADQVITCDYARAKSGSSDPSPGTETHQLFSNVTNSYRVFYKHNEREFIDYKFQPLVPHQYSKEGPGICVADINGDGLQDFFIGASIGYAGRFFVQQKDGSFTSTFLSGDENYEDMGAVFFDAENDGDEDLYIVSGGAGFSRGSPQYKDRLYVNDGHGRFRLAEKALPAVNMCGSVVTAADFDRDGDLDLFVGGRLDLEKYPLPERSFLLRNDSDTKEIRFTDATQVLSEALARPGLVSSALWTDFNQDGWIDLLVAGEWMPIKFFRNTGGKFTDVTSSTGLEKYTGLWNSLCGADFDKDGDIDFVAGNLGLNTPYRVSPDHPFEIIAKDFDKNGAIDPIASYYIQGKKYPMYNRDVLISQLPQLKKRFFSYHDYATASVSDIFPKDATADAYVLHSRHHESTYFENNGDGTYRARPLPISAQFSPVFGILANDYDNDGNIDLILAGNSFDLNPDMGQYDASVGVFLHGEGDGDFSPIPVSESGFFVDGDVKGMAELTKDDGSRLILVAQNSDSLKAFSLPGKNHLLRVERGDASAKLYYESGEVERREFYYGSGYLSASSRTQSLPKGVTTVEVMKFTGELRKLVLHKNFTHQQATLIEK